ncbi:hypothetical protein GGX14DRAFT_397835 [Mycena pura]|uniref:Uncharacterized protein n=1 Tax=Mycena pura TaxID=153505 RepID=A0AAD6YAB0_9AGAR|nr:hypothetical protein GGX14DRAFT_397835 [Mycena pura]
MCGRSMEGGLGVDRQLLRSARKGGGECSIIGPTTGFVATNIDYLLRTGNEVITSEQLDGKRRSYLYAATRVISSSDSESSISHTRTPISTPGHAAALRRPAAPVCPTRAHYECSFSTLGATRRFRAEGDNVGRCRASRASRTSPQTLKAIYVGDTRPDRRAKGEGYMQKAGAACKGQGQRAEGARDVDSTGSVQTAGEGPARTCCPRALKTGHSVFGRKYALSTCGPGSVRRRRMHSYKRAFKAATKSAMNRAAPAQVQRPSTQALPLTVENNHTV